MVEQTEAPEWSVTAETTNANCLNENGSILLNVTGGFGEITYLWSNGEATRDLSDLSSGLYTVSITDQKSNNFTESFTINLQPGPQKPIIFQNGDVLTTEEVAFSYQWYFNGVAIEGATDKSLEVSLAGGYSVETGDLLGCLSNSDPLEIEYELSTLNFFPNPSNGSLNMEIVLIEDELITFVLIDEIGRDSPLGIFDLKAGRHNIKLQLDESLTNGVYTVLTDGRSFESTCIQNFVNEIDYVIEFTYLGFLF